MLGCSFEVLLLESCNQPYRSDRLSYVLIKFLGFSLEFLQVARHSFKVFPDHIEKILGDPIVCARKLFRCFATGSLENILGDPIVCVRMLFRGFTTGSIKNVMGDPRVCATILFRRFATRGM